MVQDASSGALQLTQQTAAVDTSVKGILRSASEATSAVSEAARVLREKSAAGGAGGAGGGAAGEVAVALGGEKGARAAAAAADVVFSTWQGRLLLLCGVWSAVLSLVMVVRSWDMASSKQLKAAAAAAAAAHAHVN